MVALMILIPAFLAAAHCAIADYPNIEVING